MTRNQTQMNEQMKIQFNLRLSVTTNTVHAVSAPAAILEVKHTHPVCALQNGAIKLRVGVVGRKWISMIAWTVWFFGCADWFCAFSFWRRDHTTSCPSLVECPWWALGESWWG